MCKAAPAFIVLVVLTTVLVGCSPSGGRIQAQAAATPQPNPSASPTNYADIKSLFFADQTLEEVANNFGMPTPPEGDDLDPWLSFKAALVNVRGGKPAEAKNRLRGILALPNVESRVELWAWRALRSLGERPPPHLAGKVQGVVFELHNEAGIGTMAAYADGRARWLGGRGKLTFWEATGMDQGVSSSIAKLLNAAGPLVKTTSMSDTRRLSPVRQDSARVSILTFSGIHVIDATAAEVDSGHRIVPVMLAAVELLNAISAQEEKPRGGR